MITKQVTVSGSVGKQVFATSDDPVVLQGFLLDAPTSAANVVIRQGNASGGVVAKGSVPVGESLPVYFPGKVKSLTGLHVKVTGVDAECYLYID